MGKQKPTLNDLRNAFTMGEGESLDLLKIAAGIGTIRDFLPSHFDDKGTEDVCRTIRYLILKAHRDPEFIQKAFEEFPVQAAYNFMRIEHGEMTITGRQDDRLGKQSSSFIAISEKAKGFFEIFIEPRNLNFQSIWQDAMGTIALNFDSEAQLSDSTLFQMVMMAKLQILRSQYNLLMSMHLQLTRLDEKRALKELIYHYVKLIKNPRKQLDLFQGNVIGMGLYLSKTTTTAYCLKAIEIFQEKLEILGDNSAKVDLEHLRANFLPRYQSCFISYSRADHEFAQFLSARLSEVGVKCWLDKHEILPGDNISASIDQGIKSNDRMILICSKHSLSSWWVDKELSHAIEREKMQFDPSSQIRSIIIPIDLDGHIATWDGPNAPLIRGRNILRFNQRSRKKTTENLNLLLKALLLNKYYDNNNLPD